MKSLTAVILVSVLLGFGQAASAQTFSFEFDWGDIPLCNTGSPNTVKNPVSRLSNVPAGTKFISFTLSDLDVPSYNHGGGSVPYTGQTVIEPGAFTYESPFPPSGSHSYQWEATGKDGDGFFSGSTGSAKATRSYP
jgi:phosphatidylethanolamine-binding protein (PEBP) family uncharacterized protein